METVSEEKVEKADEDLTYRNMLKPRSLFFFDFRYCFLPFLNALVT